MNAPTLTRPTLLLAATMPEAGPVARALGVPMKAAQVITPDWLLVTGGLGGQRMVAALHRAVRQKQVGRVIHFGFAGGLDPAMKPGDMPAFTTLAEPSGRVISLMEAVPRMLPREETPPDGPRLLSVPYAIHTPADKLRLFKHHHACAVDMESFAIAQACAQMKLPCAIIRAVSDPVDLMLPFGSENWIDYEGKVRTGRVLRHVLFHPGVIPTMFQLSRNCRLACQAMTPRVLQALREG